MSIDTARERTKRHELRRSRARSSDPRRSVLGAPTLFAELVAHVVEVPAVMSPWCRQLGGDVAGRDVALDRAQRQPESFRQLTGCQQIRHLVTVGGDQRLESGSDVL